MLKIRSENQLNIQEECIVKILLTTYYSIPYVCQFSPRIHLILNAIKKFTNLPNFRYSYQKF